MARACDEAERSRMPKGQRPPSKTALFDAAKAWDLGEVQALVEVSPQLVQATDPRGRTALHLACAAKPGSGMLGDPHGIETVTALLAAGAGLEVAVPMDEDEEDFRATPLWYAVARGENLPLVQFLLKRGADASYSLWAAVWRDDEVLCRHLLKSQPKLNLRAHGETPIFYAARLQRLKTLDLLIEAGADPTIPDRQGRDAVDIAQARRLPRDLIGRLADLKRRIQDPSTDRPALNAGHPTGA
jgi:ankyrin repeat protein